MLKKQRTQREGKRAPGLSAGYAEKVITKGLDFAIHVNDYEHKPGDWTVHDDLWVRALAIKSNNTACKVIISCDLHGLDYQFCQTVRDLINEEVPRAEIILVCSTTRYGLPEKMLRQSGTTKNVLREWLLDTISQTALSALALLSPVVFRSVVLNIAEPEGSASHPVSARILQIADRLFYKPVATIVQMDNYPWTDDSAERIISADFAGFFHQEMKEQNCGMLLFLPGIYSENSSYISFEETRERCADLISVINRRIRMAEWQVDPQLIFASSWFKLQPGVDYSGIETLHNRVSFIRIGEMRLAALPLICTPDLGSMITDNNSASGVISQTDGDLAGEMAPQSGRNIKVIEDNISSVILETVLGLIEKQLA